MATFLFRCPNTRLKVQGWSAEEMPEDGRNDYETTTCAACGQLHWVNQASGRVLGDTQEET